MRTNQVTTTRASNAKVFPISISATKLGPPPLTRTYTAGETMRSEGSTRLSIPRDIRFISPTTSHALFSRFQFRFSFSGYLSRAHTHFSASFRTNKSQGKFGPYQTSCDPYTTLCGSITYTASTFGASKRSGLKTILTSSGATPHPSVGGTSPKMTTSPKPNSTGANSRSTR